MTPPDDATRPADGPSLPRFRPLWSRDLPPESGDVPWLWQEAPRARIVREDDEARAALRRQMEDPRDGK